MLFLPSGMGAGHKCALYQPLEAPVVVESLYNELLVLSPELLYLLVSKSIDKLAVDTWPVPPRPKTISD